MGVKLPPQPGGSTPAGAPDPFAGAPGLYAIQSQAAALAKIAKLAKTHPDWVQKDATHWATPGGIIHELFTGGDGNPMFGSAWTTAESRAFLAGLAVSNGTQAPSGASSSGAAASKAPKLTAKQQAAVEDAYRQDPAAAEAWFRATSEDPAAVRQLTSQSSGGGGQFYGFDTPEQAQAYAASIAGASPQQLSALTSIAGQTSAGNASNLDYAKYAADAAIDQAKLDLDYAQLTSQERQQAAQIQASLVNSGLDANSARMQALSSIIANRNNNATNLAQASGDIAAQAAQFASNPRDAISDILYRTAIGGTTPYGGTDNPQFGNLQTALAAKFQELFGGVGADLAAARTQRDQPIPAEFSNPISVPQVNFSPTSYKAPQISVPKIAAPAPSASPAAMVPAVPAVSSSGAGAGSQQNKQQADMLKAYAAYHPEDQAAQMKAAWLAYHPNEPIPFAEGGTVTTSPALQGMSIKRLQDQIAALFNVKRGAANYSEAADVNLDGIINSLDLKGAAMSNAATPQTAALQSMNPQEPVTLGAQRPLLMPRASMPSRAPAFGAMPNINFGRYALGPYGGTSALQRRRTPRPFAEGGELNFDGIFDGRSQPGMSPSSSEGGTNLNIHERAVIVGESGQVYGTLGEKRPDGTVRAEQLIIKPLKSEVAKDKQLEDAGKAKVETQKATMSHFDQGGTATAMPDDFYAALRNMLSGIDPQARVNAGQKLPDPRLLGADVYTRILNGDTDLRDYLHSAYSSQGISDATFDYTIKQGRPDGYNAQRVRYQ